MSRGAEAQLEGDFFERKPGFAVHVAGEFEAAGFVEAFEGLAGMCLEEAVELAAAELQRSGKGGLAEAFPHGVTAQGLQGGGQARIQRLGKVARFAETLHEAHIFAQPCVKEGFDAEIFQQRNPGAAQGQGLHLLPGEQGLLQVPGGAGELGDAVRRNAVGVSPGKDRCAAGQGELKADGEQAAAGCELLVPGMHRQQQPLPGSGRGLPQSVLQADTAGFDQPDHILAADTGGAVRVDGFNLARIGPDELDFAAADIGKRALKLHMSVNCKHIVNFCKCSDSAGLQESVD